MFIIRDPHLCFVLCLLTYNFVSGPCPDFRQSPFFPSRNGDPGPSSMVVIDRVMTALYIILPTYSSSIRSPCVHPLAHHPCGCNFHCLLTPIISAERSKVDVIVIVSSDVTCKRSTGEEGCSICSARRSLFGWIRYVIRVCDLMSHYSYAKHSPYPVRVSITTFLGVVRGSWGRVLGLLASGSSLFVIRRFISSVVVCVVR